MGLDVKIYKNIKEIKNLDECDFTAMVINSDWDYKIKNLKKGIL